VKLSDLVVLGIAVDVEGIGWAGLDDGAIPGGPDRDGFPVSDVAGQSLGF